MYKLNIGIIQLRLNDENHEKINSFDEYFPEETEEYHELMLGFHNSILERLKNSGLFNEVKIDSDFTHKSNDLYLNYCNNNRVIESCSTYIEAECCIPEEDRYYPTDRYQELCYMENFKILYNMKLFACYGMSNLDEPYDNEVQIEARELLTIILENDEYPCDWTVEIMPPCPIHPNIWIEFTDQKEKKIEASEYTIIHRFPKKFEKNADAIVRELIESYSYFLFDFIEVSDLDSKIIRIKNTLLDKYKVIIDMYKTYKKNSNFVMRRRAKSILNNEIIDIKIEINNYVRLVEIYKIEVSKLRNNIDENEIGVGEYYDNYFYIYPKDDFNLIYDIISDIEAEIMVKASDSIAFKSAIIGSIAGVMASNLKNIYDILAIIGKTIDSVVNK